jgi:hypothetical protein
MFSIAFEFDIGRTERAINDQRIAYTEDRTLSYLSVSGVSLSLLIFRK